MDRRALASYWPLFGIAGLVLAVACESLTPYPGEEPNGPYHAGSLGGGVSGGGPPDSGFPDGFFFDGEFGDGSEDAPSLCAGCSLITTAVEPQSLTLDSAHVYWTEGAVSGSPPVPVSGAGAVNQASRGGIPSAPVPIASGLTGPRIVKYGGTWLGWSAEVGGGAGQSSVSLVNVSSSSSVSTPGAAQDLAYGVAIDSANIYWTSNDGSGNCLIQSAPLTGGGVSSLGSTTSEFVGQGIAVNATTIYFVATVPAGGGGLFSLALTGGPVQEIWTAGSVGHPVDVALDGKNVYWTDYGSGTAADGAVYSMPLGGGKVTTMAPGVVGPLQLALDSTNVYFSAFGAGAVYEVPIGSTVPVTIATGLNGAVGVAADDGDSLVYFTTSTQVLAHPKI